MYMTSVQLNYLPLATLTLVSELFRIPPILNVDVTAIADGCEVLALLNFLYLLLIWLQIVHGLALVHRSHCERHCHS